VIYNIILADKMSDDIFRTPEKKRSESEHSVPGAPKRARVAPLPLPTCPVLNFDEEKKVETVNKGVSVLSTTSIPRYAEGETFNKRLKLW
jgi:hypothetical protein